MDKPGMSIKVNVAGLDSFQELIDIAKEVIERPDVPQELKDRIKEWVERFKQS